MSNIMIGARCEVRVTMPHHLRTLASVDGEVRLSIASPATTRAVLDALENRFPMLRGTVRDHVTAKRRPKVRFYAAEQDITHQDPETPLPEAISSGSKPFMIVGAISGG
ncbi:MAG: MoaD/ThiS family protein [Xanthomonadales bacterium]|nr:MoaD/ThiS family protein [Xanthomonadales bacterium]